ncbi:hypothetical protein GE09DRAFT_904211, partial [Coniochaeta sp. 2T2.1]
TWGLFPLVDESAASDRNEHFAVDIIAIHGLNGDRISTWTNPDTKVLWLRDLLPKALPGCRVYTYGYPSKVIFNKSVAAVREYSQRLLSCIRGIQDNSQGTRPIIFVCHSLGGIVFKQALVIAHEDNLIYGELLTSVAGVVFMGTPHRGSGVANAGNFVGRVVNMCHFASLPLQGKAIRTDLLENLSYDAKPLLDLAISVRNRLQNLKVASCYETEALHPFDFLVVTTASALLNIPGEEHIALSGDHRDICRFAGGNTDYQLVARAILQMVENKMSMLFPAEVVNLSYGCPIAKLTTFVGPDDDACLKILSASDIAEYQRRLPRPVTGTCRWIVSHPVFLSWAQSAQWTLLWLTGHPGCGKTTLSLFLAKHFNEPHSAALANNACVYFCDDKVNGQRDAQDVLLGVIFQLVSKRRSLIRHVTKMFKMQNSDKVQSVHNLWNIFENITSDPSCGTTCVLIDALDECEGQSRVELLRCIRDFTETSSGLLVGRQMVKFIITSRPTLLALGGEGRRIIDRIITHRISIDEGERGYDDDLRSFISERVDELAQSHDLSSENWDLLRERLYSNSGQTFLWVTMVLTMLEKNLEVTVKDFRNIVKAIPHDLQETYEEFIHQIPSDHQTTASKLLKLVLGSSRPLTLDEFNIAFTIDSSHRTSKDVASNYNTRMDNTLQGIIGPLIRISESKVTLVHQSAKDFLLHRNGKNPGLPAMDANTEENCALAIASACVQYLRLDDFAVDICSLSESDYEWGSHPPSICQSSIASGDSQDEGPLIPSDIFDQNDTMVPDACRLLDRKRTLYRYAALHWAEHFSLCEASAPDDLREGARTLLNTTHGSNWFLFLREHMNASDRSFPQTLDLVTVAAYFNLHETLEHYMDSDDITSRKDDALFWAAQQGHTRLVKTLLKAGADPTVRVSDEQCALLVAAQYGHLDCVVALLEDRRTDVNQPGKRGRTALMYACSGGYNDIVALLRCRDDIQVNEEDYVGATALFWAVARGHAPTVSELMRCAALDLNHTDKDGRTALSWAAEDGAESVLKTLLKSSKVAANLADANGFSPLLRAAHDGCTKAVKVLLQYRRVDKNAVDNVGRNAIHLACWNAHFEVLRQLVDSDFPGVDDADKAGWTPLMWAIVHDKPHMVDKLIATGLVEVDRQDKTGRTALSWAVEHGHLNVVRTLLRAGAD